MVKLTVDVSKYYNTGAAAETLPFSFKMSELGDITIGGVRSFDFDVKAEAHFTPGPGSAQLDLKVSYVYNLPCDRCYEQVTFDNTENFSHTLVKRLNREDDEGLYIETPGDMLDIGELVFDDIVLSMPTKVLCSDDCLGLCPVCGCNLNETQCNCKDNDIDPRLEILKTLLDNDKV